MSCNCQQTSQKYREYEQVKRIATIYANSENKEVYIYCSGVDYFWEELDTATHLQSAVEYISPLLRTDNG